MKYWVIPLICKLGGFSLFLFLVVTGMGLEDKTDMLVSILAGVALFSLLDGLGQEQRFWHVRNVLVKHGFWQTELIKKKDLPKTLDKSKE